LGLRSSPRKRLQLTETKETATNTSPEKSKKVRLSDFRTETVLFYLYIYSTLCSFIQNLPPNKRQRLEGEESPIPLEVAIKGLSHSQLISLIQKITSAHPVVKQVLYNKQLILSHV